MEVDGTANDVIDGYDAAATTWRMVVEGRRQQLPTTRRPSGRQPTFCGGVREADAGHQAYDLGTMTQGRSSTGPPTVVSVPSVPMALPPAFRNPGPASTGDSTTARSGSSRAVAPISLIVLNVGQLNTQLR